MYMGTPTMGAGNDKVKEKTGLRADWGIFFGFSEVLL
jgi:hypothetical protein